MPRGPTRTIGIAATKVPGLKRVPVLKLLAVAELGLLARRHYAYLNPQERWRLLELVRVARGRPRNLSAREREELSALVEKLEPRRLVGEAADKLSPVRLPRRLVYGGQPRR